MKRLGLILICLWSFGLSAEETLPPRPAKYFNDYANVVPGATTQQLNERLASFERETSNQLVVAIFPRLLTATSIEDFTVRTAKSWQIGQKDKRNGAVLFVFIQDRKLRIEVGYGLEGALPDAICKRIVSETMTPFFRKGDYAGGVSAGVNAMIAATKGEYQGTGKTIAEQIGGRTAFAVIVCIMLVVLGLYVMVRASRGLVYSRRGYRRRDAAWDWNWGSGSSGGSSWGGGSAGGGSIFSGGGGDFGGGGASGSW